MQSSFFRKFQRVTYSTHYLPEIDGLRFLAIFLVVVVMHITNYLNIKLYDQQFLPANGYWRTFPLEAGSGVALFFVISGFILSLPFAKWRLDNGRKISLKNYYLRRVTRLEPPYIIVLIICFIAQVWVLHMYSFKDLLPHFFASVIYSHGLIYRHASIVLPVAWSLEVEVQFYILAPFIFSIFLIRNRIIRRLICVVIIVCNAIYWFDVWTISNVVRTLHSFFIGILLSDLYCSKTNLFKNKRIGFFAGIIALLGFIFIPSVHCLFGALLKMICIFVLIHTVLMNPQMKKLFSIKGLVIIGGMCYSIYLLHFFVISMTGHFLLNHHFVFSKSFFISLLLLFTAIVLVICSAYFVLVEKPFMKPIGIHKTKTTQ